MSLGRNVGPAIEALLGPHGLNASEIAHWLIHPGGPSILDCVQSSLHLDDNQLSLSWQILTDHGNCSSASVLLMLTRLIEIGIPRPGDWGVMMAFGPGLTLETCLLRF